MKVNAQTLKGFRDFLPQESRKRQYVISTLKQVFESFGFEPLETPSLEYEDILLGKYGDEGDKLMYRFEDNGKRKVAMRYDQTVPLARVVAQYQNELPIPFKRYQVQPVWRAENTQKGRFREFLQCDVDIVGVDTPLADAEVIALAVTAIKKLGFKKFKVLVNDRTIFSTLVRENVLKENDLIAVIRSVDKLKKIGQEGVLKEIQEKGYSTEEATDILESIEQANPTGRILEIQGFLEKMGIEPDFFEFSPTLARGLDYYTELIIEVEIEGYTAGSVAGGGRYNNLVGMFQNSSTPAVGFAFGFDRLLEAIEEFNLLPKEVKESNTKVLFTLFEEGLLEEVLALSSRLRLDNINTEVYLNWNDKIEKQLKYADKKKIPYVAMIGPDEARNGTITLKNLMSREQKTIPQEELEKELQ